MNKTGWYIFFALIFLDGSSICMEKKHIPTHRWQELALVLPRLTTIEQRPIPTYGMLSGTRCVDVQQEVAYQKALISDDPITALQAVSMPVTICNTDFIAGKWKDHQGKLRFPLADFARGVRLAEAFGNTVQATRAFEDAQYSVYRFLKEYGGKAGIVLSHEEPIAHAAACARLLLNSQHDAAFSELVKLQAFAKNYPSWKKCTQIQRAMLADCGYKPALEQLAAEGDVNAQYKLIEIVCAEAVQQKDIEAQYTLFKELVPYFESLLQHPKYRELCQLLTQYTAAACSYERNQYAQTTHHVLELLERTKDQVSLQAIRYLTQCLLEAVVRKGDMRARCFVIAQQLQDSNKKVRRTGLENAEKLVQALIAAHYTHRFDEFGIVQTLEHMASKNNGMACVLLAQWKCHQALAYTYSSENREEVKAWHQVVKLYAQLGLQNTKQQPALLKTIIAFTDGVITLCEDTKEKAAKHFIAVVDTGEIQNELDAKIRNKAGTYLIELAQQGEWQARCRYVLHRVHQDGNKTITQETQDQCCVLARDFLDRAPQQLYKQACSTQLVLALQECTAAGNAQAQYLISCLMFRILHVGNETTGLGASENPKLFEVFKQAAAASKAGVQEATLFVKAVMQYRGALGLLEQKKHDLAIEQLLGLLDVNLPKLEKKMCKVFAQHQLITIAQAGHPMAGGWHVAQLLAADNQAEMTKGLAVCERVFYEFLHEYDIPCVALEKWQKVLEPFKKFHIIERLQEILRTEKYKALHSGVAYILSSCYLLQSMIAYEFMNQKADEVNATETLLKISIEFARQAYALATDMTKDIYHAQLGQAYYRLGYHYIEKGAIAEAIQALSEGSRLLHPPCMRACAMVTLEQAPLDGAKMDKRLFDAQIATIEQAYKLGDMAAGAILVEHYFDGDACRFACGYALELDREKAVKLACNIGASYPQVERILGLLELNKLTRDPKNKGKKIDLGPCAKLLMSAAAGKQGRAFDHLRELCLSPGITKEIAQEVIGFLEARRDEYVPEAACALGSIVLADKDCRYIEDAILCFEEAILHSNGLIGHYELAKLYVAFEWNGKKDVLKAADHCVAMIEAGARRGGAAREEGTLAAQILVLLKAFEGSQEEKLCAQEKYDAILARLEGVGVQIVLHDPLEKKRVLEQDVAFHREVVHEEVLKEHAAFMKALRSVEGDLIDHLFSQPADLEKLRVVADAGDSFAQYVMSKICMRYGKTGKDVHGKKLDQTKAYIQAACYVKDAVADDKTNEDYVKQFCAAYCQLFQYCRTTVIPETEVRQDGLDILLAFVNQGLEECKKLSMPEADSKKIKNEALSCMKALVCKGSVKALEIYLSTHLYASHVEAQKTALEVICSCCYALHEQGSCAWQDSGITCVLEQHIPYIQQLVDAQKNAHAALTLCLWYGALHENMQEGPATHEQTKAVLDLVYQYCCKAKEWGSKEAIPTWNMLRLSQPEKLSEKECQKALRLLEGVAQTNVHTSEFLIRLYTDGGVLPCGYIVGIDRARAKKIALHIAKQSRMALLSLAVMAKEAGEHEEFLKYAVQLHQAGIHDLDDIVQYCLLHKVYPISVHRYLEQESQKGNDQAAQAMVIIKTLMAEPEEK